MADQSRAADPDYATTSVSHREIHRDRAALLRKRKPVEPECVLIGHAWTEDPARHGGQICIVCAAVRLT